MAQGGRRRPIGSSGIVGRQEVSITVHFIYEISSNFESISALKYSAYPLENANQDLESRGKVNMFWSTGRDMLFIKNTTYPNEPK